MSAANSSSPGLTWLCFALLTVGCWGVYGVFLHTGQTAMQDPVNGRYKALLFVGIACFLTAVLAPLAMLMFKGATFSGYTPRGILGVAAIVDVQAVDYQLLHPGAGEKLPGE